MMRFPVKCVVLMLPLLMAACDHKQQKAQLPPLAPPDVIIPPPANALPPPNETIPTKPTQEAPTPPLPVQKPVVKKKKPKPADATDQAANTNPNPNPEVSAVGQLSSGDPAELHRQTEDSIASVEQGLKNINRPLGEQEQKTADHIREFIKEAKAALASRAISGVHAIPSPAKPGFCFGRADQRSTASQPAALRHHYSTDRETCRPIFSRTWARERLTHTSWHLGFDSRTPRGVPKALGLL